MCWGWGLQPPVGMKIWLKTSNQRIVVLRTATTLTLKKIKVMACCQLKGPITMIMHAKYQCSIINTSEDMSQVKVFVADRQRDGRTNEFSIPPLSRKAGDKKSFHLVSLMGVWGKGLCVNIPPQINRYHTYMPPCHLHLLRSVDVGEEAEAESLRVWRVGESIHGQGRLRGMKRLSHTIIQLVVRYRAPKRRLFVRHRLGICGKHYRWFCGISYNSIINVEPSN